jgi:hypothetical protein
MLRVARQGSWRPVRRQSVARPRTRRHLRVEESVVHRHPSKPNHLILDWLHAVHLHRRKPIRRPLSVKVTRKRGRSVSVARELRLIPIALRLIPARRHLCTALSSFPRCLTVLAILATEQATAVPGPTCVSLEEEALAASGQVRRCLGVSVYGKARLVKANEYR